MPNDETEINVVKLVTKTQPPPDPPATRDLKAAVAAGVVCSTIESRARRAAARIGLRARKSRWRQFTDDNHGGFQVIDPDRNLVVAGERYDWSAEDVITWCAEQEVARG